ncbi:MAG: hypothetical protein WCG25_08755 [bacterium]
MFQAIKYTQVKTIQFGHTRPSHDICVLYPLSDQAKSLTQK